MKKSTTTSAFATALVRVCSRRDDEGEALRPAPGTVASASVSTTREVLAAQGIGAAKGRSTWPAIHGNGRSAWATGSSQR